MLTTIKLTRTHEIALIGILAALNIASRIFLQGLPNIKPVTSIIIISVLMFGLKFGVELSIVTTIVSNLFLGMGIWTFFQILAWTIICLLSDIINKAFIHSKHEPPLFLMALFAFLMGYVFGFFVSLDKLMIGGLKLFIIYYLSGLSFDTLHAIGNFGFYFVCFPLMKKIFTREISIH